MSELPKKKRRRRSARKNPEKRSLERSASNKAANKGDYSARRKHPDSSRRRNNKNSEKKRGNKGRREFSSIYDIFGAKRSRFSPQNKPYHPEFNEIELPELPADLVCAICKQKISEPSDILEALEIHSGEFRTEDNTDDVLPAHFQCVLQALTEACTLQEGETVAYLGSGKFAVVTGPKRVIKRMIERSAWSQNSLLSPTNWSSWRQNLNSHTLLGALSIETDI